MDRMEQMEKIFNEFLEKTPTEVIEKMVDEIKEDFKNVESTSMEEYFDEIKTEFFSINVTVNILPPGKSAIYKAGNSKEYARAV